MTNPKKIKWNVKTIRLSKYHYRAVFEVGVQGFTLADEWLPKGSSRTEILEAKERPTWRYRLSASSPGL